MEQAPPVANPYVVGSPVTHSEMFFGRQDVFDFVRQTLVGRHQDNVIVLYGQRRTGKTSVLYQMRNHLDPSYIPILIDLQGFSLNSLAGFFLELATTIQRQLRRDWDVQLPRPESEAFAENPLEQFQEEFLNSVWEAIGERHLLLMIDEVLRLEEQTQAGKLEPQVFDHIRSLMQHSPRLNFILSVGTRVTQLQGKEFDLLFNTALYKEISFLDRRAAIALITEPARDVYRFSNDAIERIFKITSGHAYYTQLLCHSIFSRFGGEWSVVTAEDVEEVIGESVERATVNLKFVWDDSPFIEQLTLLAVDAAIGDTDQEVNEKEVVRVLATHEINLPPGEVTTALRNLVGREVLSGTDSYRFSVQLLRQWLIENQRIEWLDQDLLAQVKQAPAALRETPATPAVKEKRGHLVSIGIAAFIAVLILGIGMLAALLSGDDAPARVPIEQGAYAIDRCALPPVDQMAWVELCVQSVDVLETGELRFNMSWGARIAQGALTEQGTPANALLKRSDVGNSNIYVIDDQGNRYDFTDLGGASAEDTNILRDNVVNGWFLFPQPQPGAKLYTFHDDDNFWAIPGVSLEMQ
ncbi:MAG: ATP-binding protein [Chloroflexi bacterium]|nr:ATP-binding protein [Chloroflexota bacterium]